jgi:hypothetical protein
MALRATCVCVVLWAGGALAAASDAGNADLPFRWHSAASLGQKQHAARGAEGLAQMAAAALSGARVAHGSASQGARSASQADCALQLGQLRRHDTYDISSTDHFLDGKLLRVEDSVSADPRARIGSQVAVLALSGHQPRR